VSSNLVQKTPVPWEPLPYMKEYLDELASQLRAEDYIRKVKTSLSYFATFAASEGIRTAEEVERAHIVRFQSWVNAQDWASSYTYQLMVYLRGWLNWLEAVEYIEDNPWRRIKLKSYSKQPKPIGVDELSQLFETHRKQAFSVPPFYWHRREVILILLYGWGLRIHELVALTTTQMDLRQDFVSVRQKGGRTKNMPYTEPIKDVVSRYLRTRVAPIGEDSLLVDLGGRAISIETARKTITDLGKAAGIDVNPHRLRDTFGTDAINSDVPVERIQKLMGHTNIKQTLAYSDINNQSLFESHDAAMSPRLNRLLGRPSPS
jgi:integrase/recombinase XerD